MTRRSLFIALAAFALTVWVGKAAFADEATTHDGTVVSVTDSKLTMTDKDGKEHSHDIAATTPITLNGREAKLADLKKGDKVRVSMGADNKVTKIEAKRE